jgi:hypothetical protein
MKFKKYFFIVIFSLASIFQTFGNNPDSAVTKIADYSISFFNNSKINPALTGITGKCNFSLEAGIDKPLIANSDLYRPQSYSFLSDGSFGKKRNMAIGLFINETKGGAFENSSIGLSVSKNFNLIQNRSKYYYHKLRVGIAIELSRFVILYDDLTYGDMINPRYGFVCLTNETKPASLGKNYFNFSAGFWYHNPFIYLGLSAININEPSIGTFSVSKIPMEFILSLGGNIKVSNQIMIHPSINGTVINGFKGKLNSYTPAIICSYREKYNAGLSFMDLNKIGIHAGCVFAKHFNLLATCAFSTNTDLYQLGTIGYLGGEIQYNLCK